MSKTRVLRGQWGTYSSLGAKELIRDDFRFNHGYRVTKFRISFHALHSSTAGTRDMYAVLATSEDAIERYTGAGSVIEWNWEERGQIAWTSSEIIGDSHMGTAFELVDPTHIVVRELWFALTAANVASSDRFNYYIELEEIELDDNQAVMAIISEVSSNE